MASQAQIEGAVRLAYAVNHPVRAPEIGAA
jgi:hypothetical protein